MNKLKIIIALLAVIIILLPHSAHAAGVTSVEYDSETDSYTIYFDPSNVSSVSFKNLETGGENEWNYSGQNYMDEFKCNATFEMKFYDSSGAEIDRYTGETTQVQNENDACGDSDSGGSSGDSGDDCGCIFNTPGWADYMDEIGDIKDAIPPAPNWDSVAETFSNEIVPNMISETENMLGGAPSSSPEPPEQPTLDDGNLQEPEGQEDPDLGDSAFDGYDIKNEASEIEEREDPSGGFQINDPVDSIPDEGEFKEEAPDVPEIDEEDTAPEVPDVPEDSTAPEPPQEEPPEQPSDPAENEETAPTPPDQDNQTPGAPEDPDNIAPDPGEVDGTAPTPPQEDEPDDSAPLPGGNDNTAPLPGGDDSTAPIPGEDNNTAPLPDENDDTAPMPG